MKKLLKKVFPINFSPRKIIIIFAYLLVIGMLANCVFYTIPQTGKILSAEYYLSKAKNKSDNLKSNHYLSKALNIAKATNNQVITAKCYLYAANILHLKNENDSAITYGKKGLVALKNINTSWVGSTLLLNLGLYFYNLEKYDSCLYYCTRALNVVPSNHTILTADIEFQMGLTNLIFNSNHNANNHFNRAYELYELANMEIDMATASLNSGMSYLEMNMFNQAFGCLNTGLYLSNKVKDQKLRADSYFGLGILNKKKGNISSATYFLKKAGNIYKEKSEADGAINAAVNISECYLNDSDSTKAYLENALKLADDFNSLFHLTGIRIKLGAFFNKKKRYNLALMHLKMAEENALYVPSLSLKKDLFYNLSETLTNLGKAKEADTYRQQYYLFSDSLISRTENHIVKDSEEKYLAYRSKLAQISQKADSYRKTAIYTGLLSFILLSGLIVSKYYGNQRISELKRNRSNLTALLDHLSEGIIGMNQQGKVLFYNIYYKINFLLNEDFFSLNEDVRIAMSEHLFQTPDKQDEFRKCLEKSLLGISTSMLFQRTSNELVHFYEILFHPLTLPYEEGDEIGVVLTMKDITFVEMKRQMQQEYNSNILNWTIKGQEKERERIARDLHDSLAQLITGIRMKTDLISQFIDPNSKQAKDVLISISEHCKEATSELKTISAQLVPHTLEKMGLIKSLIRLIQRMNEIYPNICYSFETNIDETHTFTSEEQLGIYRIAQEALQNTGKYSHATKSELLFLCDEDEQVLFLIINDNGSGFNPSVINEGLGIYTMQSRTQLLNGQIDFINESENMTIKVTLPMR